MMDKQQAAEASPLAPQMTEGSKYDFPHGWDIEEYRKDVAAFNAIYFAGWEARDAQQSAEQTILCPECKGDGFIPTTGKQVDGTYQVDCEICETAGRIEYPSPPTQQSPTDAVSEADSEMRAALGSLLDEIPPQTPDADWWHDGLTEAISRAEKAYFGIKEPANPSGAAPQHDCPIGKDGHLVCKTYKEIYAEADEWEGRCRLAEAVLKELVNLKNWKERIGKDEVYILRQPLVWEAAKNHLATYYDEYEKDIPLPPAAPAAGPVWVKATTEMPVGAKERERISIKYKGLPDVLIFLKGQWHWWDDLHDKYNPMIEKNYFVQPESWSAIEWLKESAPAQQVFTREQMKESFHKGIAFYSSPRGYPDFETYMNTNYGSK